MTRKSGRSKVCAIWKNLKRKRTVLARILGRVSEKGVVCQRKES